MCKFLIFCLVFILTGCSTGSHDGKDLFGAPIPKKEAECKKNKPHSENKPGERKTPDEVEKKEKKPETNQKKRKKKKFYYQEESSLNDKNFVEKKQEEPVKKEKGWFGKLQDLFDFEKNVKKKS